MSPHLLLSLRLKNQVPYPHSPRFIYVFIYIFIYLFSLSWVRVFYLVKPIGYGLGDPGFEFRLVQEIFSSCKTFEEALGPTQPPIQWVTVSFSGIELLKRDVNHSQFSAVINNEWSYTFTASACLHAVGNQRFRFNFICLCDYLFVV